MAATINATNLGMISSGTYNSAIATLNANTISVLNAGTIASSNTSAVYANTSATVVQRGGGADHQRRQQPRGRQPGAAGVSVDNYGQIANGVTSGNTGGDDHAARGLDHGARSRPAARRTWWSLYTGTGTSNAATTTTYADAGERCDRDRDAAGGGGRMRRRASAR